MKGAIYREHSRVNKLSQVLGLSSAFKPFKKSKTEKISPCKKNSNKTELLGLNEKNIISYLI
jgi:hypothetical protein